VNRPVLFHAAVLGLSLAVALVLAELALRLVGFSNPLLHVPDELAGVRLRAGAEGVYRDEGEAFVRINAHGWRDRPRQIAKPADVLRVAVLGDSFMEALQVDLEATFSAQLEQALTRCRPAGVTAVEVLNFGVASYGTAQELLTLQQRVWPYSPDVVLLSLLPGNDVRNNSLALEGWKARPFFVLREGKLVLDASFRDDAGFVAKMRSAERDARLSSLRLHQLFRRVREGAYRGWNDAPAAAALSHGAAVTLGEAGMAERVYLPPQDREWEEAWSITEKLLVTMHSEVRARGARFSVMVIPGPPTVYPDAALRKLYADVLGVSHLLYPEERVRRLGEAHGLEVIYLAEPMQARADKTGAFMHGFANTRLGFGHWNEHGHAFAAQLAAERLCATLPSIAE
jgi:hypothetical protein